MRKTLVLISAFTLFYGASVHSKDWRWADVEIFGQKTVSRAEIRALIPVPIGAEYVEDRGLWRQWCDSLKAAFGFVFANCSSVRYGDSKAYLVVDVVEAGDESRLQFRSVPERSLPLADAQVLAEFNALMRRDWELFLNDNASSESSLEGYLDYSDSEMSSRVKTLLAITPKYRHSLIEVLEHDRDPAKRARAADLLNWALDVETSIAETLEFLNDPSGLVRNQLSRFMLHYFGKVKDAQLRRRVILKLVEQLGFPSHGDRNKAVYGLLEIAKEFPIERAFIRSHGLGGIKVLSESSILDNVKNPAVRLLALLNERVDECGEALISRRDSSEHRKL